MKVLVCGGRHFNDKQFFDRYMDNFHWANEITFIIHGDCPQGADRLAERWAEINRIDFQPYTADWNKHGFAAGPLRNRKMLDEENPDVVIAFPGNKGTADMVEYAKQKNVEVLEVDYGG